MTLATANPTVRPIPKIQRLIRSDKRYRVAYGGRGSGKSYGVATAMVMAGLKEPGIKILCTRETQNTLSDSSLAVMKRVISDHGIDWMFEPTVHGLKCRNGTEYIFRGLQQPDRIKSLDGVKYCYVEEAQRIAETAWQMLVPTIREPKSAFFIVFNPDTEHDPVWQRFVVEDRDDVELVKINYYDNHHFPDVLRSEMAYDKAHDYDRYLWVWEGQTRTISDALVFKGRFKVQEFETPRDAQFLQGADWGFAHDPTTLVRCFVQGRTLLIDHEAYGVGVEIDHTPDLFRAVPEADKWMITADSARPETISYMRRQGWNIRGARKGKGSIEDGIALLKSFDIVIHPRCRHVIDEFKTYSYIRDRLTGEPTPRLEDKNNHMIDALRYACERLNRPGPKVIPWEAF